VLLKAVDHVGDASGLDAMTTRRKLVVVVLELGVEQLDLVEDLPSSLSISSDVFDLREVLPLVEASHSVMEHMVFSRGSVNEVSEPGRERFDQLQGRVVGGCI
jgi:hypothetical protein